MDYQGNGPPVSYPQPVSSQTQSLILKKGNPWGLSPNPNAPFDQSFYLILNVAVGGTSGYFP
jgi:hypothetical protein